AAGGTARAGPGLLRGRGDHPRRGVRLPAAGAAQAPGPPRGAGHRRGEGRHPLTARGRPTMLGTDAGPASQPEGKAMNTQADVGKLVLGVTLGVLILPQGLAQGRGGLEPVVGMVTAAGLPGVIAYGALIGEVLAPLMLLGGFHARIGAV